MRLPSRVWLVSRKPASQCLLRQHKTPLLWSIYHTIPQKGLKKLMVDNGEWWFMLVEKEVAFVKVQPRKGGSFMVTIPKEAVNLLRVKDGERLKVFVDVENRRLLYQL